MTIITPSECTDSEASLLETVSLYVLEDKIQNPFWFLIFFLLPFECIFPQKEDCVDFIHYQFVPIAFIIDFFSQCGQES